MKGKLVAVDTPESLMGSFRARRTLVKLERVNDSIVSAVTGIGLQKVTVDGNDLVIEVNDPEKQNPVIVRAIVSAGGNIQFVNDLRPTLEDVYLKLVRE